jgi:hypothetical protein
MFVNYHKAGAGESAHLKAGSDDEEENTASH